MKGRNFGRIAMTGLGLVLLSTPAFAQQEGGGLNLIDMFQSMGPVAIAVAVVLFIMSFWSVGVAIERIYTYSQARKQSKLYAPQVAKHLKDGRLKEAIALSGSKDYRYSHLAKVVLAGLQEYQFQQERGGAKTCSTRCAVRFSAPPRSRPPTSRKASARWPPSDRRHPSSDCSGRS